MDERARSKSVADRGRRRSLALARGRRGDRRRDRRRRRRERHADHRHRRSSGRARPRSTHTGGGKVTETEVGDEESAYEVEVTRDDGSQVDVQLDRDFKVVGDEAGPEVERRGRRRTSDMAPRGGEGRCGAQRAGRGLALPALAARRLRATARRDSGASRRRGACPRGREHGRARPGRVHDRDRQPLLADDARHALGLPRDRHERRRAARQS